MKKKNVWTITVDVDTILDGIASLIVLLFLSFATIIILTILLSLITKNINGAIRMIGFFIICGIIFWAGDRLDKKEERKKRGRRK